jgi:GAF domain-containing protein
MASQRLSAARVSRPSYRPPATGRRATGDELIANLFEAMHELNFARDVIEGGDYCLSLAMDMIPSRAGILHLYDIDRREFVVGCVSGAGAEVLLNRRHPENEPLLSAAMRRRRAVVLADARAEESAQAERFTILGGAITVVCSPVLHGGRFLGAIEIANPLDGIPFTEHEGNALDYIGEQFAEFVASRGVQLDVERILRRSMPVQAPG